MRGHTAVSTRLAVRSAAAGHTVPTVIRALAVGCLLVTLFACAMPRPTVKIALVAPFEGRFRQSGYDAFPALRLALREQIIAGGIGNYQVEFVAYNDDGDLARAQRVAHNVAIDSRVIAVIGHLHHDTTLAAAGVYTAAGLSLVAPDVPADQLPADPLIFRLAPSSAALSAALRVCAGPASALVHAGPRVVWPYKGAVTSDLLALLPDLLSPATARLIGPAVAGLCVSSPVPYPHDLPGADQALAEFREVSGGFAPGPRAISTYNATRLILSAMRADVAAHGTPTRAGVAEALRRVEYAGLLGRIMFDASNAWVGAPVWVYQYNDAGIPQHLR